MNLQESVIDSEKTPLYSNLLVPKTDVKSQFTEEQIKEIKEIVRQEILIDPLLKRKREIQDTKKLMPFGESIPKLSIPNAIICLFLNTILPGFGTFYGAIFSGEHFCFNFLVGFLQILTTPLIIGYFWAILWSVVVLMEAANDDELNRHQKH